MNRNQHCRLLKGQDKESFATNNGRNCSGMSAYPYSPKLAFNCRHCDLFIDD